MYLKKKIMLTLAALSLATASSSSLCACTSDNYHEYSRNAKECAQKSGASCSISMDILDVDKAQHASECAYNIFWGNTWGVSSNMILYNLDLIGALSMSPQPYYYYYSNPPSGNVGSLAHLFSEKQDVPMMRAFYFGMKQAQERFSRECQTSDGCETKGIFDGLVKDKSGAFVFSDSADYVEDFWKKALSVKNKYGNSFLNVMAENNNILGLKVCLLLGMPIDMLKSRLGPLGNTALHTCAAANQVDFLMFAADLLKSKNLLSEALQKKTHTERLTLLGITRKQSSHAAIVYLGTLS